MESGGSATATGRSCRIASPSTSPPPDLAALREAHPSLAADLADAALEICPQPRLPPRRSADGRARRRFDDTSRRRSRCGQPRFGGQAFARRAPTRPRAKRRSPAHAAATTELRPGRESTRPQSSSSRPWSRRGPAPRGPAGRVDAVLRRRRPAADDRSRPRQRARPRATAGPRATTPASTAGAGALLLADLGSTNGSWVNDRRVEEMALGEGDRIRVGDTILVVESFEDA